MNVEKIKAVVIGHAVADALGVPVEFSTREKLAQNPVTEMTGFGHYDMPAGSWSDDTSMTLCTMEALGTVGLDYEHIMQNFVLWYNLCEFTPTGVTFDIGITCSQAINDYFFNQKPALLCGQTSERANGNGSLMRIHPVVLYLAEKDFTLEEKLEKIYDVSALTHAHMRSKMGCGIYAFVLWELLKNPTMSALKKGLDKAAAYYAGQEELAHYSRLFEENFALTESKDIRSSGYIVHSLEAAIWCILTTESYKEAVLKAVNLGEDTDTVAAIAGGLAGALYGYEAIPQVWRDALIKIEYIEELCEAMAK